MTWWQLLVICGCTVALNLAITESREIAYKHGYRAGVRAYRRRLTDVVSERDERRKHYPWRQPTGDRWRNHMAKVDEAARVKPKELLTAQERHRIIYDTFGPGAMTRQMADPIHDWGNSTYHGGMDPTKVYELPCDVCGSYKDHGGYVPKGSNPDVTAVDHECTRNMLGRCDDCGRPA